MLSFYLALNHAMLLRMSWLVLVSLGTRLGQVCDLIASLDL
jgi:hypothetical protein